MLRRALLLAAIAATLALPLLAVLTHGRLWTLPDRHNPWAPLTVEEVPGWLTRHKLQRLASRPAECRAVLAGAGFDSRPVPDRETAPACGFSNAVRVQRAARLGVGTAFVMSCRGAVSLALWERHVVVPQAEAWFGAAPARLEHLGSYACRNVYGRPAAPRSQHATADALDVSGFVLADGRRVTVARDWAGHGAAGRFLRAVHAGACPFFDGVLGPDYNSEHADHLHLDRGPYRVCR